MKRFPFLLLICALFSHHLIAQELSKDQSYGYILDSDGKKHEGIIELASLNNPWENQTKVYFIDKAVFESKAGKISKKDKEKFDAKDVKEYMAGTRKFVTIAYSNVVGATKGGPNKLTGAMTAAKNLGRDDYMAEVITTDGKISLYRFYNAPPPVSVTSGEKQAAELEQLEKDCRENYDVLFIKQGEKEKAKAKAIARPTEMEAGKKSLKDVIDDCEVVLTKYKDGGYTMKPVKKGIKGMMQEAFSGKSLEEKVLEIVADYNKECGK